MLTIIIPSHFGSKLVSLLLLIVGQHGLCSPLQLLTASGQSLPLLQDTAQLCSSEEQTQCMNNYTHFIGKNNILKVISTLPQYICTTITGG